MRSNPAVLINVYFIIIIHLLTNFVYTLPVSFLFVASFCKIINCMNNLKYIFSLSQDIIEKCYTILFIWLEFVFEMLRDCYCLPNTAVCFPVDISPLNTMNCCSKNRRCRQTSITPAANRKSQMKVERTSNWTNVNGAFRSFQWAPQNNQWTLKKKDKQLYHSRTRSKFKFWLKRQLKREKKTVLNTKFFVEYTKPHKNKL